MQLFNSNQRKYKKYVQKHVDLIHLELIELTLQKQIPGYMLQNSPKKMFNQKQNLKTFDDSSISSWLDSDSEESEEEQQEQVFVFEDLENIEDQKIKEIIYLCLELDPKERLSARHLYNKINI